LTVLYYVRHCVVNDDDYYDNGSFIQSVNQNIVFCRLQ